MIEHLQAGKLAASHAALHRSLAANVSCGSQERRFRDVGYRSVHHPIADMRADIAGRRFVLGADIAPAPDRNEYGPDLRSGPLSF